VKTEITFTLQRPSRGSGVKNISATISLLDLELSTDIIPHLKILLKSQLLP
jgi:hypothetical protein